LLKSAEEIKKAALFFNNIKLKSSGIKKSGKAFKKGNNFCSPWLQDFYKRLL
jgi:hypothetical protein